MILQRPCKTPDETEPIGDEGGESEIDDMDEGGESEMEYGEEDEAAE